MTHGLDLVLSSLGSDSTAEEARRVEQSQQVVKAKGHGQQAPRRRGWGGREEVCLEGVRIQGRVARCRLCSQSSWVLVPPLLFISCVPLRSLFHFSLPQFPHW